jgi:hypothetical protein
MPGSFFLPALMLLGKMWVQRRRFEVTLISVRLESNGLMRARPGADVIILFYYIIDQESQLARAGNPDWRGRFSTFDLLVLTSHDQLLFY